MNKMMTILAAIALSFGTATASVLTMPLSTGEAGVPFSAKVVAVKAVSSTAAGTVTVKEVVDVASTSTVSETKVRVIPKDSVLTEADAFVGQTKVYTGSGLTVWSNATAQVVSGGTTNTVKVFNLYDEGEFKYGPVTNIAASVRIREIVTPYAITVTNTVNRTVVTHTPYTNDLYSGTLSSGYLSEAVSNKFLLGGSRLVVGGTAFTGGNAYLILER